jgi:hypothetical protein
MAPTKKRKEPPQATTLLKFFSGNSTRNGKLPKHEPSVKAKRPGPLPQDVIVIDSDDDQDAVPKTASRAMSTYTSSDVEFVDNGLSKVNPVLRWP